MGFPLWMAQAALIGLFTLRGRFGFGGQYRFNGRLTRSVMNFRTSLVSALLRLDAQVCPLMQPGTAVSKVVNDPHQIMQLVGGVGISLLRDGLPALAMLVDLFYLNRQLTLLSLVVRPLTALVMKTLNQRMRLMATCSFDAQLLLFNTGDDLTRAWRVLRQFGAIAHECEPFAALAHDVRHNKLKTATARPARWRSRSRSGSPVRAGRPSSA